MEFQIMRHRYENTGGGCMVSFDDIWIPAENRTVFATTNEEGVCFYTADAYHGGFELEPYEYMSTDSLRLEQHTYFDIMRECLRRYAEDSGSIAVPFTMLTSELQGEVPEDYLRYCDENGMWIETDGRRVLFDPNWDPVRPVTPEQWRDLECTIALFTRIADEIDRLWRGPTGDIIDAAGDCPLGPDCTMFSAMCHRWEQRILDLKERYVK